MFGDIEQGQMILNAAGNVVKIWWPEMKNKFRNVELDEFIITPNHFHGIVFIETDFVGAIHELPLQKDLPEGWVWSTIGKISEKPQYGWTTKAKHEEGHLKLLRTTDITSGTVDWFNFKIGKPLV